MSETVKRYFTDCNKLRSGEKPRDECDVHVVLAADYARLEQECEVLTAQRAAAYDSIEGLTQLVAQTQDERDAALKQVDELREVLRRASKAESRAELVLIIDEATSAKP